MRFLRGLWIFHILLVVVSVIGLFFSSGCAGDLTVGFGDYFWWKWVKTDKNQGLPRTKARFDRNWPNS